MTQDPLDNYRREAKALQNAFHAGDVEAQRRVRLYVKEDRTLKRADFLHVLAREQTYASWPVMKEAVVRLGPNLAHRQRRLEIAVINGRATQIKSLAGDDFSTTTDHPMLAIALFDKAGVAAWLDANPNAVNDVLSSRGRAIHQLAFSRALQVWPEREADMLAIADMLLAAGAKTNDVYEAAPNTGYGSLTPLYGAIGFADNLPLARWLLAHGANPTDGEAFYHGCEVGHPEGLRLLCEAGGDPRRTNALKRAMDFDDPEMVRLLLDASADPNEGHDGWTALHHAALRMNGPEVCQLIVDAGADPGIKGKGITAYAAACVYGNTALAAMLPVQPLSPEEELLAQAVTGEVPDGVFLNPNKLAPIYLDLVREFAGEPSKLDHIKALIKLGMPWDQGDMMGVPPVQIAGWLGQPEMLAYFLGLKPDLSHRNDHGGTLLSTTLHGVAHNPNRAQGDYISCLEIILKEGVALPENAIWIAGEPAISEFLSDWAERYPGQVVKHGFP